ncbi:MAG: hypothetical protein RBU27_03840 [Bacteroidota bacterium]|jgi:hypothetical protein|nr:hypothetical protein [Bacteroidota bacterium]
MSQRTQQFTVRVDKAIDGYDASIPSIRECEVWAGSEDDALHALVERLAYFLQKDPGFRHDIDYMRKEDATTFYKLIIRG